MNHPNGGICLCSLQNNENKRPNQPQTTRLCLTFDFPAKDGSRLKNSGPFLYLLQLMPKFLIVISVVLLAATAICVVWDLITPATFPRSVIPVRLQAAVIIVTLLVGWLLPKYQE